MTTNLTARELAKALGSKVTDKGARDLLNFLIEAGAAKVIGRRHNNPGGGRAKPANDYGIDAEKLEDTLSTLREAIASRGSEDSE